MDKQKYKCTKCGLKAVVVKEKSHELPKCECQTCGTMTMQKVI